MSLLWHYLPHLDDPWAIGRDPPEHVLQQLHYDQTQIPYPQNMEFIQETIRARGQTTRRIILALRHRDATVTPMQIDLEDDTPTLELNEDRVQAAMDMFKLAELERVLRYGEDTMEVVYAKRWVLLLWAHASLTMVYGEAYPDGRYIKGITDALLGFAVLVKRTLSLASGNSIFNFKSPAEGFPDILRLWSLAIYGRHDPNLVVQQVLPSAFGRMADHQTYFMVPAPIAMFRPLCIGMRFGAVEDYMGTPRIGSVAPLMPPGQSRAQMAHILEILMRQYLLVCFVDSEGYQFTHYTGIYEGYRHLPWTIRSGGGAKNTQVFTEPVVKEE